MSEATTIEAPTVDASTQDDRVVCEICGDKVHAIQLHLKKAHPEFTLEQYKADFPGKPLLSESAIKKVREKQEKDREAVAKLSVNLDLNLLPMHEVFELGEVSGVKNARGEPIKVSVMNPDVPDMVPSIDRGYVFELETLKNALMAFELKINLYLWGHTGTGKTTLLEQVCARTKRMMLRVQHTVNTEESHIVGQWTAKGGETIFELGPLALAMKHGWVYVADEYDFALPSVLSVYQPILEGKPLVIKEADAGNRVIRPHPNFRFAATGNTNGTGDEHGLYQGTNVQNAANYDRFNMVMEVKYMKPALEAQIIVNQARIAKEDAEKMVDFANRIREQFGAGKLSSPISPRTLIAASQIGLRKGNYRSGLALSFSNKLPTADKETVDGLAQRIFG